jgi:radical SAM superfamily enzyme YgiQ (UPF0313 family)
LREFNVIIVDNNVNRRENYRDLISTLSNRILFVGISCMIGAQIKDALKFARQVREANPQIPIIWGGPLPTMLPEMTASNEFVDVAVRGQGEVTFSELVYRLKQGLPWNDVLGISYKKDDKKVVSNPDRPFVDLNKFPTYRKVYHLIDVEKYIWPDEHIASRTVSYHSSQGCPYACGFCCEVPLWKRWWSGLSPERMLEDIKYLIEKYRINGIKFYDSEFFIDLKRAITFAKLLLERKIEIKWGASIHPRNFYRIKDEHLRLLVESGLKRLLIGVESAVKEELDLIGKNITPKMILEIAKKCHSYGIVGSFTFILGYPSMSAENFDVTLRFARKLAESFPEHEVKLHLYAPYPGTPLYSLALKCGFIPPRSLEEWSDFDYYEKTTPWAKLEWVEKIREFNENYYPYMHPYPTIGRGNSKNVF